ncbi:YolD-like family protein [Heyndrickxia ginsengihumi]|uniref:YolD-like family protein n=1 Tax=Heyndrickxia ginsengihumi TaxID=363870 RepID=UPI00203F6C0B|nr:YolD-like family protein [Heyndrickxia ginsengihumi]MCM3024615.1 YolD-like family protein [Heyndrickxia ginsengihumi]
MIKDRGNKKWVAMMLPEHVEMIKQINIDLEKQEQPILDEDKIQELETRISYSLQYHLPVDFKIWIDGFEQHISGYVQSIDHVQRKFKLRDMNDNVKYINFSEIVDIRIMD